VLLSFIPVPAAFVLVCHPSSPSRDLMMPHPPRSLLPRMADPCSHPRSHELPQSVACGQDHITLVPAAVLAPCLAHTLWGPNPAFGAPWAGLRPLGYARTSWCCPVQVGADRHSEASNASSDDGAHAADVRADAGPGQGQRSSCSSDSAFVPEGARGCAIREMVAYAMALDRTHRHGSSR
jgi:hypothetical protein